MKRAFLKSNTLKRSYIRYSSRVEDVQVALTYAKPQSQEQALEFDLTVKAEQVRRQRSEAFSSFCGQEEITNSAKQALSGLNGEMWSSYMCLGML